MSSRRPGVLDGTGVAQDLITRWTGELGGAR
jgi:hypothetical protein